MSKKKSKRLDPRIERLLLLILEARQLRNGTVASETGT